MRPTVQTPLVGIHPGMNRTAGSVVFTSFPMAHLEERSNHNLVPQDVLDYLQLILVNYDLLLN